jgi:predicted CoA-binding protein
MDAIRNSDELAAEAAKKAGLMVVMDKYMMVEQKRFF